MDLHLDDPATWTGLAKAAVALGCFHATLGEKPMSEPQMFRQLTKSAVVTYSRPIHQRLLRTLYGAAYNGIAKIREAKARGL